MFPAKWTYSSIVFGACAAAVFGYRTFSVDAAGTVDGQDEHPAAAHEAKPDEKQSSHESSADASEQSAGELKLDAEARERMGIQVARVEAATFQPDLRAIGMLEEDPSYTFTVRAPVAGYACATNSGWPEFGASIAERTVIGAIRPRLTPLEQFSLAGQYLDAQSAVAESEAELEAARGSFESKKSLNANGKMVSDRQLEEAESRLNVVEAHLSAARRKLALLDDQRSNAERGLKPLDVVAERGGQVVEVLTAPGEVVESGQPLFRLSGLNHLIARIELPLGDTWTVPASPARIALACGDAAVCNAHTIGRAARVGGKTHGETWLLAVETNDPRYCPGAPVSAYLPTAGAALQGVLVPDGAIIRYGGLVWVFVADESGTFERKPIALHSPTSSGWFVMNGLKSGDSVVVAGAQMLLSEQLKGLIEAEAEASE